MRKFSEWTRLLQQDLLSVDLGDLVLRLFAISLLIRGFGGSDSKLSNILLAVVCSTMVVSNFALNSKLLWSIVAILLASSVLEERFTIDNHKYLIAYWAIGCVLAAGAPYKEYLLRLNGRLLVGLVFGFAVFWKIAGGEYFDGTFFHAVYLFDERFEGLATILGGFKKSDLREIRDLYGLANNLPSTNVRVSIPTNDYMQFCAVMTSIWTIGVESAVAICFLAPLDSALSRFRNYTLYLFVITTYVAAPVDRFGIILSIMGLAQISEGDSRSRISYFCLFVLIQFSRYIPKELTDWLVESYG